MVKEKMENKYLNEAIIGNKNMIATFTSKGELQRLYFPWLKLGYHNTSLVLSIVVGLNSLYLQ